MATNIVGAADGSLHCDQPVRIVLVRDPSGRRKLDAGSWFGPQFAGECLPTLREVLLFLAVELRA